MARRGKINWRPADDKVLEDVVSKFNAKIDSVSKATPAIASAQPQRVNSEELRKLLQSYNRNEFNRITGKMQRYLRSGMETPYTTREGVNTTVWQKQEIDNTFAAINARRKKEIAKFQPSTFKGTMGSIEQNNLRPRKNTVESIKPKNWDDYIRNLELQLLNENELIKREQYKENFLHAISATIGEHSRLYDRIENTPAEDLYRYMYTEPLLQISFTSDPREAEEIEEIMLNRLDEVEAGR